MTPQQFPIQDYVGKPVDSLLKAMPAHEDWVYVDNGRPGILAGVNLKFGERWLEVLIGDAPQHVKRFDAGYAWDKALFGQELIASVRWVE